MPIFSYLAYPVQGAKEQLAKDLAALDFCDVTPAENEEVLILVTDTPDEETEKKLQEKLEALESLESLGMTFGHIDE
jgi:nitrate reductase NapAB chaperone NapD